MEVSLSSAQEIRSFVAATILEAVEVELDLRLKVFDELLAVFEVQNTRSLLTSGARIFESRNIWGGRDGGSVVGVGVVVSVALDDDVVLVKVAVRGVEIVVVHAERVEGSHFSRG
ncbi:hypothetical protein ACFX13_008003 [Malus domestica]